MIRRKQELEQLKEINESLKSISETLKAIANKQTTEKTIPLPFNFDLGTGIEYLQNQPTC